MVRTTLTALLHDETGFIVSAELVLIATITVIGVIVGLAEVQNAVVNELNDIGDAIGSLNQSYYVHGHGSFGGFGGGFGGFGGGFGGFGGGFGGFGGGFCGFGVKAFTPGSMFVDFTDMGDNNQCAISCYAAVAEYPKWVGWGGGGALGVGGGVGGTGAAGRTTTAPQGGAVCPPGATAPGAGAPPCDVCPPGGGPAAPNAAPAGPALGV